MTAIQIIVMRLTSFYFLCNSLSSFFPLRRLLILNEQKVKDACSIFAMGVLAIVDVFRGNRNLRGDRQIYVT